MSTPTLQPISDDAPASLVTPSGLPTNVPTLPMGQQADEPWVGAFIAGLSGWTLDAFDFFLVVLSLAAMEKDFHTTHIAYALTATLLFRPVGAFVFGGISDRYGRKLPLVINLCLFSICELSTGFAHSFTQFLIIRAIFGVVMGGQWGVGVSLAMEKVPARFRGILSGLLQQGYAIGFILAATADFIIAPAHGWRPLFLLGSLPALAAALFVALKVKESEAWKQNHQSSFAGLGRAVVSHWKLLVYFTVFMMAMHMSSHGTQDLYPRMLHSVWHIDGRQKDEITGISMIGAILGGLSIGWISDRIGRRWAIVGGMIGAVCVIPLWAFSHTLPLLILGAVLMQFFVQGAWGVVPAHVAELSPAAVRGTLPGFGNQLGVCISSIVPPLQYALAEHRSFSSAMAITAVVVFTLAAVMTLIGREARAAELSA